MKSHPARRRRIRAAYARQAGFNVAPTPAADAPLFSRVEAEVYAAEQRAAGFRTFITPAPRHSGFFTVTSIRRTT